MNLRRPTCRRPITDGGEKHVARLNAWTYVQSERTDSNPLELPICSQVGVGHVKTDAAAGALRIADMGPPESVCNGGADDWSPTRAAHRQKCVLPGTDAGPGPSARTGRRHVRLRRSGCARRKERE